ncbi:MAG: CHAT domain-containing protein [Chloroflexota bacterium]
MYTLQLHQYTIGPDEYKVEINLRDDENIDPPQHTRVEFPFQISEADQRDLRWYLEDYLQYPIDPEPIRAARVEGRMAELGELLFRATFGNEQARDLWAILRQNLHQTRVEIAVEEVSQATALPWELITDPKTDVPLALRANAFVRLHPQPAQRPQIPRPTATGEPVRILLVICRPSRADDVPFRSVASRLIKGLDEEARKRFQLDVLRPPTFAQLARALQEANAKGQPYHVVHFDGHGTYLDIPDTSQLDLSNVMYEGIQTGAHGYLLFESPGQENNTELVDGVRLGDLLVGTNTPVLMLNACRSAHADAANDDTDGDNNTNSQDDEERPARAFGSLAQEVMDTGVAGVVAMRYNVYVVTAAQFMADLYSALGQGQALGAAVTTGRKQLNANPQRTIAFDPVPLQDWQVPVVYEAAPIRLFTQQDHNTSTPTITLNATPDKTETTLQALPSPDTEFIGRDETLLALDRAFDTQSIVLLHAYAGSGKTTTAAEFARWYSLTGGLDGPVIFTTFEQPKPLPQVLDDLGQTFEAVLAQGGINWLALEDEGRIQIALQIMQQIPLFWIWDNVEPVSGFPRPEDAVLSKAEQNELADFLRAARQTKAKFLLTSRREEGEWLGNLPRRIAVPPMPMQERVQLARALADKQGLSFTQVKDWRPLLKFTRGNPLTITTLVSQALRQNLTTMRQIVKFVNDLEQGEATIEDAETEKRDKSLAASLSYGFDTAFNETERKQLALLHFFQGFVDVDVLRWMGNLNDEWNLPVLRGTSNDELKALLNRAADLGLLTNLGGRDSGYFSIHPALPWFFKTSFEQHYQAEAYTQAARAFVEAVGELGNYYSGQYARGNRNVITLLTFEENNLRHARHLARQQGWFDRVIDSMQGLRVLYDHTGRRAEWRRLVHEIVPDFVDSKTDGPLHGREEEWSLITQYRVNLLTEVRNWPEAERLQRIRVDRDRKQASPYLAETLEKHRPIIRTLGISVEDLAHILREQEKAECVKLYEEALELFEKIDDQSVAAVTTFNLGRVFDGDVPNLRNLTKAEGWYKKSLKLISENDNLAQGKAMNQLGKIAISQFEDERGNNKTEAALLQHLNTAVSRYHQALELLPENAVDDLAVTNNQLGIIYQYAGDIDRALPHYREAIRYAELVGDFYRAGTRRINTAVALAEAGRLTDAQDYAAAALRNFEQFGPNAADLIERARQLLAQIKQLIQKNKG